MEKKNERDIGINKRNTMSATTSGCDTVNLAPFGNRIGIALKRMKR